jgi:hypothetical protein
LAASTRRCAKLLSADWSNKSDDADGNAEERESDEAITNKSRQ